MDIYLEGITKVYGSGRSATTAVEDVSLEIASGELFFLLGPSGCGKTSLLRIVAGLVEPTSGRVRFGRRDVTGLPVEKRNTAMVFQNYALWPHMTVLQNVQFGPKMQGLARRKQQELASDQLIRVQMADYGRRKPNQLSGGQQQRVALARALAARADCLLLDEPLSNLDARLRLQMRGELRRLIKSAGTTAIYVTHDQVEALSMADRIAVMNEGRIVQVGSADELYDRPACRFVADFLGEANFVEGRILETGPPAKVQTPLGVVLAGVPEGMQPGQEVACCIRPERIVVSSVSEAAGWDNVLPARVVADIYLGQMRQYVCELGKDVRWRVSSLADAAGLHEGQEVSLRFHADHVSMLAG